MDNHLKSMGKLTPALFTLLLILFNFSNVSALIQDSSNPYGNAGFIVKSQSNAKVEVNYAIGEFTLTTKILDGEYYQNINLPGHFLPNDAGAPNLLGSGRYIAVPREAIVSTKIMSYQSDTLYDVNIAPSFRIPKDNEKGPLDYTKKESIYSSDTFFPAEPLTLSDKDMIR